jgi:hypothetical protein
MDYRKFLGQKKELLLPYFSGPFLHDGRGQRLRIERKPGQAPPAPGFYLCELKGSSVILGAAQQPDLTAFPAVRGHFAFDLLTYSDGEVSMVQLLPADEPPRFSPLVTRRYENGALLFDSIEFESEAEEAARQAYEEQRGLGTTRGVASSLRAAFAYAIATRAAERLGIPVSPLELRPTSSISPSTDQMLRTQHYSAWSKSAEPTQPSSMKPSGKPKLRSKKPSDKPRASETGSAQSLPRLLRQRGSHAVTRRLRCSIPGAERLRSRLWPVPKPPYWLQMRSS